MNRQERAAITRLIDTFGADIAVGIRAVPEMSTAERARARHAAEERVEGCTACPLHVLRGGNNRVPLAPFWSPHKLPRNGRITVLADAPTIEEYRAGELGRGPLYRLIRQELRDNGIEPERVTYLTSVACTPLVNNARHGATRLPPDREHVATCAANTLASLLAADVTYVLALGGHAARVWRADLHLTDVMGRWFVWRNRWLVFPVEHPSVAFTRRGDTKETSQWRGQVSEFCRGVNDGMGLEGLSTVCVSGGCSDAFYTWDDDGVPWCRRHFRPSRFTRDSRANKPMVDTAQQVMW